MNISNRYKRTLTAFILNPANKAAWPSINDFDNNTFFCYLKNTPVLTPTINKTTVDKVIPLVLESSDTHELKKAEEIMYDLTSDLKRFELEGRIYYACWGYIFDNNKTPLVITCIPIGNAGISCKVICIDYSVFENNDDPMNRFIMRKFLPSIIEFNTSNTSQAVNYTFMNCKSFVIKPTFQGELDHKLVGDFLAEKIQYEFK